MPIDKVGNRCIIGFIKHINPIDQVGKYMDALAAGKA